MSHVAVWMPDPGTACDAPRPPSRRARARSAEAVSRRLGHAGAAVTLDVYSDLFNDELEAVADRLNRARLDSLWAEWADGPSGGMTEAPRSQFPGIRGASTVAVTVGFEPKQEHLSYVHNRPASLSFRET